MSLRASILDDKIFILRSTTYYTMSLHIGPYWKKIAKPSIIPKGIGGDQRGDQDDI